MGDCYYVFISATENFIMINVVFDASPSCDYGNLQKLDMLSKLFEKLKNDAAF